MLTRCRLADSLIRLSYISPFLFGQSSFSCSRTPLNYQNTSPSTLRNMVQIALEIQNRAPPNPLLPAEARIPSSFHTALDTVSTDPSLADK